tara:strand:+ start:463 stop:909 length:447 start_codon:yes stop_codon:yes gene_type:complete
MNNLTKETQNLVNRIDTIISNSSEHIGHLGKNQKTIIANAYEKGFISTVSQDKKIVGFAYFKHPNNDKSKESMTNIYKLVVEPQYQKENFELERKLLYNLEEEVSSMNIKKLKYQTKTSDVRYNSFLEQEGFEKKSKSKKYPIWIKEL